MIIKRVPGKMKDEYGGTHIYEFIGLKSTIFSVRDVNKKKYTLLEMIVYGCITEKLNKKEVEDISIK